MITARTDIFAMSCQSVITKKLVKNHFSKLNTFLHILDYIIIIFNSPTLNMSFVECNNKGREREALANNATRFLNRRKLTV